jgi:hypothetical protein
VPRSRPLRIALIVTGLVAAAAGFLLFRPDTLFRDDVVDESLEEAFNPTTTTAAPAPPSETTLGSESGTPSTTTTPTTTEPPGPQAVLSGAFTGIDHRAMGTATVYEQDGRYLLRFEDDTDIQNGPDLYVWVLPTDGYEAGVPGEFLDLGRLTGNVGGQNYELPPDFDPELHRTVLIWCLRFRTPFAAAPLS